MPRILLVDEDAGAPPRSCAVETSCHRGRAPLRQTLAVAPRHPAALQRRSLDAPWHTSRAEIVRLRGVPINRDAGDSRARGSGGVSCRGLSPPVPLTAPERTTTRIGSSSALGANRWER